MKLTRLERYAIPAIGNCKLCGIETNLVRTYFHYDSECKCCSPNHFNIVHTCKSCVAPIPTETRVMLEEGKWEVVAVDSSSYTSNIDDSDCCGEACE